MYWIWQRSVSKIRHKENIWVLDWSRKQSIASHARKIGSVQILPWPERWVVGKLPATNQTEGRWSLVARDRSKVRSLTSWPISEDQIGGKERLSSGERLLSYWKWTLNKEIKPFSSTQKISHAARFDTNKGDPLCFWGFSLSHIVLYITLCV